MPLSMGFPDGASIFLEIFTLPARVAIPFLDGWRFSVSPWCRNFAGAVGAGSGIDKSTTAVIPITNNVL